VGASTASRGDPSASFRSRDYTPTTLSAAAQWGFVPGYGVGLTMNRAQRAPGTEELYSRGAHHATGTFDVGSEDAGPGDGAQRRAEPAQDGRPARAGGLRSIARASTVSSTGALGRHGRWQRGRFDPGGRVHAARTFRQDDATFPRLRTRWQLPGERPAGRWGPSSTATRATIDNYGPAPRVPPLRYGGNVVWAPVGGGARRRGHYAGRPRAISRLAANETRTGALHCGSMPGVRDRTAGDGAHGAALLLRGINLLDEDIRLHTSYLKDGYPLAGRSVVLGLNLVLQRAAPAGRFSAAPGCGRGRWRRAGCAGCSPAGCR
jgi:iron complex outermembrane receptor protein